MRKGYFSILVLSLFLPLSVVYAALNIFPGAPKQGDAVAVFLTGDNLRAKSVTFDNQPASFFKYKNSYVAVFGVAPAKKPGQYPLKIVFENGKVFERQIKIKAKKFPMVVLGIPEKLGLTPQKLVFNLQTQNTGLKNIFAASSENTFFNKPFGLPLFDNRKIGSRFGEIRKTGDEIIRHLGIDFSASLGTPVAAINDGLVRKTYFDPIYGNAIIIDHGQGIFSFYLHLDKIETKEGDLLSKGTEIGRVGQTGYATAPHLHLSIKINNISVDPLEFVSLFK